MLNEIMKKKYGNTNFQKKQKVQLNEIILATSSISSSPISSIPGLLDFSSTPSPFAIRKNENIKRVLKQNEKLRTKNCKLKEKCKKLFSKQKRSDVETNEIYDLIDNLSKHLENLSLENAELKICLREKIEIESTNVEATTSKQSNNIVNLTEKLKKEKKKYLNLEEKCINIEKTYQSKYETISQENIIHEQHNSKMTIDYVNLEEKLKKEKKKYSNLEKKCTNIEKTYQSNYENISQKNVIHEQNNSKMKIHYSNLENKCKNIERTYQAKYENVSQENVIHEQNNSKMKIQLEDLKIENLRFQEQNKQWKVVGLQCEKLQKENKTLQKRENKLKTKKMKFKEEKKEMKSKIKNLKKGELSILDSLETEKLNFEKQREELLLKLEKLEKENCKFKEKENKWHIKSKQYEKKDTKINLKLKTLKTENLNFEKEREELLSKLEKLEKENCKFKEKENKWGIKSKQYEKNDTKMDLKLKTLKTENLNLKEQKTHWTMHKARIQDKTKLIGISIKEKLKFNKEGKHILKALNEDCKKLQKKHLIFEKNLNILNKKLQKQINENKISKKNIENIECKNSKTTGQFQNISQNVSKKVDKALKSIEKPTEKKSTIVKKSFKEIYLAQIVEEKTVLSKTLKEKLKIVRTEFETLKKTNEIQTKKLTTFQNFPTKHEIASVNNDLPAKYERLSVNYKELYAANEHLKISNQKMKNQDLFGARRTIKTEQETREENFFICKLQISLDESSKVIQDQLEMIEDLEINLESEKKKNGKLKKTSQKSSKRSRNSSQKYISYTAKLREENTKKLKIIQDLKLQIHDSKGEKLYFKNRANMFQEQRDTIAEKKKELKSQIEKYKTLVEEKDLSRKRLKEKLSKNKFDTQELQRKHCIEKLEWRKNNDNQFNIETENLKSRLGEMEDSNTQIEQMNEKVQQDALRLVMANEKLMEENMNIRKELEWSFQQDTIF